MIILFIIFVVPLLVFIGFIFWDCCKHPWKNPFRTVWKARKVFKRPSINVYIGKWNNWGYYYIDNFIIKITTHDILWKDKYDTPRIEFVPKIDIVFFNHFQFCCHFYVPKDCNNNYLDEYYEQIIWWLYYSDKDIRKAKETWPWTKHENEEETTWIDNFLK